MHSLPYLFLLQLRSPALQARMGSVAAHANPHFGWNISSTIDLWSPLIEAKHRIHEMLHFLMSSCPCAIHFLIGEKNIANTKTPAFTNLRRKGVPWLTISASLKTCRVGHWVLLNIGLKERECWQTLSGCLKDGSLGKPVQLWKQSVRPGCKDFNFLLQTPSLPGRLLIDSLWKNQYHVG